MSSPLKRFMDKVRLKAAIGVKSVEVRSEPSTATLEIQRDIDVEICRSIAERFVREVCFHSKVDADSEFLIWAHLTMDRLRRESSKGLSHKVLGVVRQQCTHLSEAFLLKNEDIDQVICTFLQEIDEAYVIQNKENER